jgi:thiamine biosynthesis protein ThiI
VSALDCILLCYAEIGLKGNNRREFEETLVRNVRRALPPGTRLRVDRHRGRIVLWPDAPPEDVVLRVRDVFGVAFLHPARSLPQDLDAISEAATEAAGGWLEGRPEEEPVPFRVTTRRADKDFPLRTEEINRHLGARLIEAHPRLRVRLDAPELDVGVELRAGSAFLFTERIAGPGGLPVGSIGRVVAMMSGGIDSPVAAWQCMKRGCEVVFLHFHSQPFTGERSREKALDLIRRLARLQPSTRVVLVPFSEIQKAIRRDAPAKYRTVLYRRMMQRIASRVAAREGALAVATGDNLGQVASQTLENIACIDAASEVPILRPLITFEKNEIIRIARRIGTYETSIRPYPDCCTVFQPPNPVIHGRADRAETAEERLDVSGMVDEAMAQSESFLLEEHDAV